MNSLGEAILKNSQNVCLPEEENGNINEKMLDPLIFVQKKIDVITNFAVIRNVVIKSVH